MRAASEKRRRDFHAGRACARAALRRLGVWAGALPIGADRAPLWPDGIVGSITHTRGYCAAAVAWRHDLAGIGIDAERRGAVSPALVARICTDTERRWLASAPPPEGGRCGDWLSLVFSAKEALFKSLHGALAGRFLDFQDARLIAPPSDGSFRIEVIAARCPGVLSAPLVGHYLWTHLHVVTALAVAAGNARGARSTLPPQAPSARSAAAMPPKNRVRTASPSAASCRPKVATASAPPSGCG
jgi:4'-phosphopantetheinyl transferase EntD